VSSSDKTALMEASKYGHIDIVAFLIESKADIHISNNMGTALVWAAIYGHIDVVKLLFKNGADPHFVNSFDETASILARRKGHKSIVDFVNSILLL
ncbi:MAG: ankyrin repeat domain-containing protein, partial [Bdellovibrionales bacterium]|nr:ankyrin repeat domain-containing protein [Bdellovibrionales bacterium]